MKAFIELRIVELSTMLESGNGVEDNEHHDQLCQLLADYQCELAR